MRTTRIYVDLEFASGQELLLPAAPSTHLLRVLRLRPGAALTVFNGRGGEYAAELIGADKAGARLAVGAHAALERESPLQLTLLQGVARGERMDFIVQKATELGVQRIVPLSCEFSVVRLDAANRQRRAASLARGGDRRLRAVRAQSRSGGRADRRSCRGLRRQPAPNCGSCCCPRRRDSLAALAAGARNAVLLVGPEGGLSGREQLLAQRCGFRACRLGPRILRTETAPLAALAALQALAGDLG